MKETLEAWVGKRIDRKRGDMFLRADFADLGAYDKVGRDLRRLAGQGKLLKIGFGLYSWAVKSRPGQRLIPPKGLATLRETLERVGMETYLSRAIHHYNAGRATQVPTGRVVAVRRCVRRKISPEISLDVAKGYCAPSGGMWKVPFSGVRPLNPGRDSGIVWRPLKL